MGLFSRKKQPQDAAPAPVAVPEPVESGPSSRTLDEERTFLLSKVPPLRPFGMPVLDAGGLTLCEDVVSDLDLPPVAIAHVEGYGVKASNLVGASEKHAIDLQLIATVAPGDHTPPPLPGGGTIFLEEGAPVPEGVDAIVPEPDAEVRGRHVFFTREAVRGAHLHDRGAELRDGEQLLAAGQVLNPRSIALLAEVGLDKVLVRPRPRIVVLGVDATLVSPGLPLTSGTQRYDSTTGLLATAARSDGATVYPVGMIPATAAAVRQTIVDQGIRADLILIVGGSEEENELVTGVLRELGHVDVADVAVNDGKRVCFGQTGDDGVPVLLLPGGAVSASVAYHALVRPLIGRLNDSDPNRVPRRWASLEGGVESASETVRYVPAVLEGDRVRPVSSAGHELAFDLHRANVLLVLPRGRVRPGWDVECLVLNDTAAVGPSGDRAR